MCGTKTYFFSDGVPSNSDAALQMVEKISSLSNAEFSGIYTHYGATYQCHGVEEIRNLSAKAWGNLMDLANRQEDTIFLFDSTTLFPKHSHRGFKY
jgi:hypothetical protein